MEFFDFDGRISPMREVKLYEAPDRSWGLLRTWGLRK
jgi:hypothetical protein